MVNIKKNLEFIHEEITSNWYYFMRETYLRSLGWLYQCITLFLFHNQFAILQFMGGKKRVCTKKYIKNEKSLVAQTYILITRTTVSSNES